jgi:putative amidoligase enzyme
LPEDINYFNITFTSSTSDGEWTFTPDRSESIPYREPTELLDQSEGEEVPENPEVTSDEVNQSPVRPAPIGDLFHAPGVHVSNTMGNRIMEGGTVANRYTVQVQFWDLNNEAAREAFSALRNWCAENQFNFAGVASDYFYDTDSSIQMNVPYYFTLCERGSRNSLDPETLLGQRNCECGEEVSYPTAICPSCETKLYCESCRKFSSRVEWSPENGAFCDHCGVRCPNEECETGLYHRNDNLCPECNPGVRCSGCRRMFYTSDEALSEWEAPNGTIVEYCTACYDGLCHSCNQIAGSDSILEDEGHQCLSCVSRNSDEEWDENSTLENSSLAIPTIPGRETIRLVGVEIEGANGPDMYENDAGNLLASELYTAGLSRSSQMGGYHSSSRSLVHVERDSSVDWEMVIGPLNVAHPDHVDILNRSVRVVRGLINDKTLKLDMRAGLHIHVGADRVPFHNAYNLHKLYMYMEDFLYRFGAAKWPYHRSINRRGRDQAGKSPSTEGKLHFARTFSGQRYYGLSFDNYFARYFEQCGCGARTYGLFDECTCDLGKCTFEFRLFNTTANTVKIHAYLAMCQALVAKAIEMDEIKDTENYPTLDFVKVKVSDMTSSEKRKMNREWEKRIVFVNENLPLTPEEKKSIHYCIMNSEMGKLVTNADILLETEEN